MKQEKWYIILVHVDEGHVREKGLLSKRSGVNHHQQGLPNTHSNRSHTPDIVTTSEGTGISVRNGIIRISTYGKLYITNHN